MKPNLSDLQKWMKWIITDPRGVSRALIEVPEPDLKHRERFLPPSHLTPRALLHSIQDAPPISREQRLDIYAEAYFARIVEVLENDYPRTKEVLGESEFTRLVSNYLKAHPSKYYNISDLGSDLHTFIRESCDTTGYEYLPAIAKLEHALVESFFADDLPALEPSRLQEIKPDEWPSKTFTLDPSVRLLELDHEIETPFAREDQYLVVYRHFGSVYFETLTRPEFRVLSWMQDGLTLEEWCEKLSEWVEELPPIMQWLQKWITQGMIRKIN